ncbi:MAG: SPASM domain-containing protein [Desulfuromonadales bacterium]|nr:SPASM domain-containing protein [Desulfuromonadales bacterium]
MSLNLLDTPVRLTWDFLPGQASANLDRLALAQRIVDGGVFFVTLLGRPLDYAEFHPLHARLSTGGCQLLVACSGTESELAALEQLSQPIAQLLLDVSGFIDGSNASIRRDDLQQVVETIRKQGHEPSLMLTPLRQNLHLIPEILRLCHSLRVQKFKLPNAHIGASFREYSADDLPRANDLQNFRKRWLDAALEHDVSLEIHDLFLWEIMTPGQQQARSEYGGCQAANSLGHIDGDGQLHPCAAWPQLLGDLNTQELYDIWDGAARLKVRRQIDRLPEGCLGCSEAANCLGGCRGLSHHLNREHGEIDLMCAGLRTR